MTWVLRLESLSVTAFAVLTVTGTLEGREVEVKGDSDLTGVWKRSGGIIGDEASIGSVSFFVGTRKARVGDKMAGSFDAGLLGAENGAKVSPVRARANGLDLVADGFFIGPDASCGEDAWAEFVVGEDLEDKLEEDWGAS